MFHVKQSAHQSAYEALYGLQEEYNQHTNITRINTREDYYLKHIEDSLALLKYLNPGIKTLIDVGSGGGYPGLPLAIERPEVRVTLNDSTRKKTDYLAHVIEKLGLKNAYAVQARVEDLGQQKEYREKFDSATARALAEIPVLLEYLTPLVKVGGWLYLLKGNNYQDELSKAKNAEKLLGLNLVKIESYALSGLTRALLIYQKIAPTSSKYPRKAGTPKKTPL